MQLSTRVWRSTYRLVAPHACTMTTYASDKKPAMAVAAMKSIVDQAPEKPYTISSDRGEEFVSPAMQAYLASVGIKARPKEKGDPNTLGVVDKAIQILKKIPKSFVSQCSKAINGSKQPEPVAVYVDWILRKDEIRKIFLQVEPNLENCLISKNKSLFQIKR